MGLKARVLGVIPARLGSSRLPRKPLHPIAGRPLVEWVWRRSIASRIFHEVVIATDSVEVASVAREFGAKVEMTRGDHPSGTDRVAEVASRDEYSDYEVVVNVQGDEPFVSDAHLAAAVDLVTDGWPVGTIATRIEDVESWRNPAVVKVVCGADGAALLFTRAPVPHLRDREPTSEDFMSGAFLRHIGIYAYARDALATWVRLPEGRLERMERLEQLRPLAHGVPIGIAIMDPAEPGIDTPEDAERADRRLREAPALTHPNGRATP